MIRRNYCVLFLIGALLWGAPGQDAFAQGKKNKEKYDKLFKDKKVERAVSDFISLHKVDNKVYFEVPLSLMGQELLLGATVTSVSDATYITVGQKTADPIHFRFEIVDDRIVMKKPNNIFMESANHSSTSTALALNYGDPSIAGFKIDAYNPDSTAVVFDATSLVGKPNSKLPLIPKVSGEYGLSATPRSELSFVKSVKSFPGNASIRTELNYELTVTVMGMIPIMSGMPTTLEATFSIIQLPDKRMTPRIADARVGYSNSRKYTIASEKEKIKQLSLIHRWRLEPKDSLAYANGKLSEPKRKITFYLDDSFPADWKEPIRKGVLQWNKAFEEAGFKEAIQVLDFPKDDPNFDPDNLSYSCIRYIPNFMSNVTAPFWVDPMSGEILNASVFVYNNVEELLYKWRFLQTANVDPRMQTDKMPKEIFDESLTYLVTHEVGHTLGLVNNMGASSAYPTESLRSETFTQKYGTTPSVMDYARFNYVAQPSDKGVRLTPPDLGVYDLYAIDWGYRYYPEFPSDYMRQAKELEKRVDVSSQQPMLMYKPEQTSGFIIDPTAVAEDLGDDPIKSSDYGMRNLAAINKNLQKWIRNDEDSKKKSKLNLLIAQQYHAYLKNVMHLVGGIKVNVAKESSSVPRYQVIPRKQQREALLWAINHMKTFPELANRDLERKGFINISYYDQLVEFLAMDLFRLRTRVIIAEHIDPKAYSQREFFEDVYTELFRPTMQGRRLNSTEMYLQRAFVDNGHAYVRDGKPKKGPGLPMSLRTESLTPDFMSLAQPSIQLNGESIGIDEPAGGRYPQVDFVALDKGDIYYYEALLKLRPLLEKMVRTAPSEEDKAHYLVLLYRVKFALDKK